MCLVFSKKSYTKQKIVWRSSILSLYVSVFSRAISCARMDNTCDDIVGSVTFKILFFYSKMNANVHTIHKHVCALMCAVQHAQILLAVVLLDLNGISVNVDESRFTNLIASKTA